MYWERFYSNNRFIEPARIMRLAGLRRRIEPSIATSTPPPMIRKRCQEKAHNPRVLNWCVSLRTLS